ncbi:MAG: signal peptidase I [Thermoprotei archaeon]|nr:MAG: signal peptidase I [Thermoprotei archaeon]
MHKALSKRIRLSDLVLIAIIILLLCANMTRLITGFTPLAVIEGRSMMPMFKNGDIVFVLPATDISIGDIIIYKTCDGKLVIHRVIDIVKVEGKIYYTTKGDGNEWIDFHNFIDCSTFKKLPGIPSERVVGKVLYVTGVHIKIPYIGLITIFTSKLLSSI